MTGIPDEQREHWRQPPVLNLETISAKWLHVCGGCDAGMGPCTCWDEDPRPTIDALVREAEEARQAVPALLAENDSLRAQVGELTSQLAEVCQEAQ